MRPNVVLLGTLLLNHLQPVFVPDQCDAVGHQHAQDFLPGYLGGHINHQHIHQVGNERQVGSRPVDQRDVAVKTVSKQASSARTEVAGLREQSPYHERAP